MGGEFVGLVAGGDADDGELFLHREAGRCGTPGESAGFFLVVVGEFGE